MGSLLSGLFAAILTPSCRLHLRILDLWASRCPWNRSFIPWTAWCTPYQASPFLLLTGPALTFSRCQVLSYPRTLADLFPLPGIIITSLSPSSAARPLPLVFGTVFTRPCLIEALPVYPNWNRPFLIFSFVPLSTIYIFICVYICLMPVPSLDCLPRFLQCLAHSRGSVSILWLNEWIHFTVCFSSFLDSPLPLISLPCTYFYLLHSSLSPSVF